MITNSGSSEMAKLFNRTKNSISSYCFIWSIIVCLILLFVWIYEREFNSLIDRPQCNYVFHGGSPSHKGSCWCGEDKYCLCTPSLAIDAIIEVKIKDPMNEKQFDVYIILIERRDPPQNMFAIPGGFVELGETVEMAVLREVKEETNLTVSSLEQFKMYSDPKRDKRRHTASMVFRVHIENVNHLHRGDDAKKTKLFKLNEVLKLNLAFDHRTVLSDYIIKYHPQISI
eukprot:gene8088-10957_t